MAKRIYESVIQARLTGNFELLQELGRRGGVNNGKKRKKERESRERLQALERGAIASPHVVKRRQVTLSMKRYLALLAWARDPEVQKRVAEEREQLDRDAHIDLCPLPD